MVLSLVFVRSYNFGWSPVYDCKAYLETNTVKNCSYFGFGDIFWLWEHLQSVNWFNVVSS